MRGKKVGSLAQLVGKSADEVSLPLQRIQRR